MNTESMSKIEDFSKVSKPGEKGAKNTNGTKKVNTHKEGNDGDDRPTLGAFDRLRASGLI